MLPVSIPPSLFVGRQSAMDALGAALDESLAGRGGAALLVGEPGIGKTRTAEELATRAEGRTAGVFWGRCYEGEGAPAFWPWVQLIRAYARARPTEMWLAEMGAGAADIARLIPEVRERLPRAPLFPSLIDEQTRFQLFESITNFWVRAAQAQPLVLILDDLHWADTPSLLLLQFLAHALKHSYLLVVGTYRDVEVGRDHPLTWMVAELSRAHASPPLSLTGLESREVARFIELATGQVPSEAMVAEVMRETAGNPFFITELLRLRARGAFAEGARIPQSVRGAIRLRLGRLSVECNRVLNTAAVIGRDFSLSALSRLGLVSSEALLTALEEASNARLITTTAGSRYCFMHALVRETLYDELSAVERMHLHQQVGTMLEGLYAADTEPHLAELAHHFAQAAPSQIEKAIHYTRSFA